MKKCFIVGGKFADIPTILAARSLGYYVITSGNNKDDLGHKYGDKVALEDYSNKEKMLELISSLKVDSLIPACDDFSILTCAYVNDFLHIGNFDSFEVTKIIHHKDLWRAFCKQNNINSPLALGFDNKKDALKYIKSKNNQKIIIKPIDSAAGKGVNTIDSNSKDLENIIETAFSFSKDKRIVIEDFIEGTKHGFSTILVNKKVIFYFYDDEQYDYNPFAVSGTTTSTRITKNLIKNIIKEIEKIANILDLKDGIFHTQTIINKEGKIIIIESCRRAGGDLYSKFASMALNINYPSLFIKAINGMEIKPNELKKKERKFFARQCIMSRELGVLEDIIFNDEIKSNIIDLLIWSKKGDIIEDTKRFKAGIAFLEFKSKNEMDKKINNLGDLIKIKTMRF